MKMDELLNELYSYSLFGIKLGLENIKKICDFLGNPEKKYYIIHVAGSNGKGSTSTIIENVLLTKGYKVGKYTSPHILKFNERIRANGKDITDKELSLVYEKVKNAINHLNITPTFFEVTTAIMFLYFAEKNIDYAIIEVGMGGRFDATNIADGDISIITNVSLEHTEYLGNTIYDITKEKAGIIKEKSFVIIGDDNKEFIEGIETKTKNYTTIQDQCEKIKYNLDFNNFITNIYLNDTLFELSLFGDYQVKNFLCAYKALKHLNIEDEIIKSAIKNINWQCRFEIFRENPLTILEGAHNKDGIKNLKQIITKHYSKNEVVLIISILKDKKIKEMLEISKSFSNNIILTSLNNNPRGLSAEKLFDLSDKSSVFKIENNIKTAYEKAINLNKKIIIVCGSFYTCEKFKKEVEIS